ncbi:MAG: formyltransferase family protein [Bacteroidota bacterium]
MKIVLITQEEPFYLPRFFQKFKQTIDAQIEVVGVVILPPFNGQSHWLGVIRDHFFFYGLPTFIRQGWDFVRFKVLDFFSKPTDQGQRFYSVKKLSQAAEWPLLSTNNINHPNFISHLKALQPELLVSVACPQLMKAELLAIPARGAINLHAGPLPRYRGMAPLFWCMLQGEKASAVSIHQVNDRIDDGPILAQQALPIEQGDSLDALYLKLIRQGPHLLAVTLDELRQDRVTPQANSQAEGSYFSFPDRAAGRRFRKKGLKFR